MPSRKNARRNSIDSKHHRPILWVGGTGLPGGATGRELASLGHPVHWEPISSKARRTIESLEPVVVVIASERITPSLKSLLTELAELKSKIDMVVFQLRRREPQRAGRNIDGILVAGPPLVRQMRTILATSAGGGRYKEAGIRARAKALKMDAELSRLRDLAVRDDLTCLYNLRFFNRSLVTEHQRAQRFRRRYSLVFLDLDGLREVNARSGHMAGGQVLKQVGDLLMGRTRRIDVPARIGGDEFVVICPETEKRAARLVAERLRHGIQSLRDDRGEALGITASIGVACYPEDGDQPEAVLAKADRALYEAKAQGKNRVCCWGEFAADEAMFTLKGSVHDRGEASPLDPKQERHPLVN